jgi:hypothetical protein
MLKVPLPIELQLLDGRLPPPPRPPGLPRDLCRKLASVPQDAMWVAYTDFQHSLGIGWVRSVVDLPLPWLGQGLQGALWRGIAIKAWQLGADSICLGRTTSDCSAVPSKWDMDAMQNICRAVSLMGLHLGGYGADERVPREIFSFVPGRGERRLA